MTEPSPDAMEQGRHSSPLSLLSYTTGVVCQPVGYALPCNGSAPVRRHETHHEVAVQHRQVEVVTGSSNHVDHPVASANLERSQRHAIIDLVCGELRLQIASSSYPHELQKLSNTLIVLLAHQSFA